MLKLLQTQTKPTNNFSLIVFYLKKLKLAKKQNLEELIIKVSFAFERVPEEM